MAAGWAIILFLATLFVLDDYSMASRLASSIIVGLLLGWVTWRFTQAAP